MSLTGEPFEPDQSDPCGVWNAWVACPNDIEESRRRFRLCPERCKEVVAVHVKGVLQLASEARRNTRQGNDKKS